MKRIINYTGLLFLLLLILNSCRQDEMVAEAQQQSEKVSKFGIFSNKKEGSLARENDMHYQEGFRYLYFRYFELYPEEAPDFEDTSIPQVDFRFATHVFYEEDSTKMVFYPIVQDGKVIELLGASLNADDTYLSFFFHQDGEFKDEAIASFERKQGPDREVEDTDIEEVVIPIYRPIHQQFPGYLLANFTLPGSGGCDKFGNCSGGGGDLPSPVLPQPQVTPCEQAQTASIKATDLSNHSEFNSTKATIAGMNNGLENGAVLGDVNGHITPTSIQTGSQYSIDLQHSFSNPVADIHNHSGNTPPSPGDFYGLITANNKYTTYTTRYVINPNGTVYALVVTNPAAMNAFLQQFPPSQPDPNVPPTFPQPLFNEWDDISFYNNDNKEMALAFMLDKYNTGIALTKMDGNGNFKKLNVSTNTSNGNTKYNITQCP